MPLKKTTIPLPAFASMAWNSANVCKLQAGPTYNEIVFTYANCTIADITGVQLSLAGNTIVNLQGSDLQFFEAVDGNGVTAGFAKLKFYNPNAKTQASQNHSSLVTLPNEQLLLTVTLGVYGGGGAAPQVSIGGEIHTSASQQRRWIVPYKVRLSTVATLGVNNQWNDLPTGVTYNSIHFLGVAGGVSWLQLQEGKKGQAGKNIIFDRTQAMNSYQLSTLGKVQQTTGGIPWFHFYPAASGFSNSDAFKVPSVNAVTANYNGTPGSVVIIADYWQQIGANPNAKPKAATTTRKAA